jgi:hypothetical protein
LTCWHCSLPCLDHIFTCDDWGILETFLCGLMSSGFEFECLEMAVDAWGGKAEVM